MLLKALCIFSDLQVTKVIEEMHLLVKHSGLFGMIIGFYI